MRRRLRRGGCCFGGGSDGCDRCKDACADGEAGNPDLEPYTSMGLDLSAEYYPDADSIVSLAVFYKDITNPVERAVPDASGSAATRGITFINQDDAELLGVELDANMDLIDADNYILFLGGNVSYIDSEVTLSDESLRLEGANADGRELQGQSEWLANLQLGMDHYPTEQKFTLLFNFFDDRIFRVARGSNGSFHGRGGAGSGSPTRGRSPEGQGSIVEST